MWNCNKHIIEKQPHEKNFLKLIAWNDDEIDEDNSQLSSPSPKSSPPRPNAKPKEVQKPKRPFGTGGDTKITWATTTT